MNYLELLSSIDQWVAQADYILAAGIINDSTDDAQRADFSLFVAVNDLTQGEEQVVNYLSSQGIQQLDTKAASVLNSELSKTLIGQVDELKLKFQLVNLNQLISPIPAELAALLNNGCSLLKDHQEQLAQAVHATSEGEVLYIRTHEPEDASDVAQVYYQAIHAIPDTHYNAEQKSAWAPVLDNEQIAKWQKRVEQKRPFIAEVKNEIVGFIELETDGHIDCFYVAPQFQRAGIGQQLYQQAKAEAKSFGLTELYVEASKIAEPFFAKQGFEVVKENFVTIGAQQLENKTMRLKNI